MTLTENTTVRDLLQAHPETFPVLLNHGMCGDCRENPPPVPLSTFAEKHCGGNLTGLIAELQRAMVHPA